MGPARHHTDVQPQTKSKKAVSVADIARDEGKMRSTRLLDVVCEDNSSRCSRGCRVHLRATTVKSPSKRAARDQHDRASDAGRTLDFTAYSTTPYVIEQALRRYGAVSLEEAIAMLTSIPADLYGLRDRGRLVEGACADVVVFDPDTVRVRHHRMRFDLPAGAVVSTRTRRRGALARQRPAIVEGTSFTEERPGTVFRAGRDTATPAL